MVRELPQTWVACLWVEQVGIAVECARLPHMVGEPFVLATADGIVCVASDEAAHWGVKSGMAVHGARSLCDELIVLPYDSTAYEVATRSVLDVLATESDTVDTEKPELAYAEIRGTRCEITNRLRALAETVAPRVGVPVRVGVGRTKFVAWHAARGLEGKSDALVVPFGEGTVFLAHLPLSSLPNAPKLDHKARQQIERLGVKTLGDIWALPPHRLPNALRKAGQQLLQWAQGYDSDPVKALYPPRSVVVEERFDEGICDRFFVENALARLVGQASCKLASVHEFAREVTLKVGLEDKTWVQETEKLATPESQAQPIHRAVMRLLQRFQIKQPVVSLEIVLGELGTGSRVQLSLMGKAGELPHERMKRLESILVHLRREYGPRAVIPASLLAKARRIHLWTHPLGHLLSEPLEQVATDGRGTPVRYWRRGGRNTAGRIPRRDYGQETRCYDVLAIHNRWRESGKRNGVLADADVWRVETNPFGVSELRHLDTQWSITAGWD